MKPRLLPLLLLTLFMGGCALTTDTTTIAYRPAKLEGQVEGAANIPVRVVVDDQRTVRGSVGVKKNGYGIEKAETGTGPNGAKLRGLYGGCGVGSAPSYVAV